jgi:hypothetical protein
MILENIIESNAIEVGHAFNQLNLTAKDRKTISKFLVIVPETIESYGQKVKYLKEYLLQIPGHEEFVKNLKEVLPSPSEWHRYFPIYLTPRDHLLHATYMRVKLSKKDIHYGLPVPEIFEKRTNVLRIRDPYLIESYTSLYIVIKPFGYDFPDMLDETGIVFNLCEITNPKYTCIQDGIPTLIKHNSLIYSPMTDRQYTIVYKEFILNRLKFS